MASTLWHTHEYTYTHIIHGDEEEGKEEEETGCSR